MSGATPTSTGTATGSGKSTGSGPATGSGTATGGTGSASSAGGGPAEDGVLATLRGSPAPVRALLAGVFLNRLGRFFQVYLVLFLTTQGFSAAQAGLALGGYGIGTVVGVI